LDIRNVGGVFVVVCGGCALAAVIGIIQWIVNARKIAKSIDVSFRVFSVDVWNYFVSFKSGATL
jgi:hypothetical protein